MKILLIFLLIACATCEIINSFYNIFYNTKFIVDVNKFPSACIPKANLYFTIPVENIDLDILEIQFLKGDTIDFKVKVSGFYKLPTESEIVNGTDNIELEQRLVSTKNDSITYTFRVPTLKKQDKYKYLVFTILNNEVLHYLSLIVHSPQNQSKEAMQIVIKEFTIYNVNYKKEEIINKTTLLQYKGILIFLLENEELQNKKLIRLKFNQKLSQELLIPAVGLKERLTKEVIIKQDYILEKLSLRSLTKDENYYIYEFHIENQEINKQKYIAIAMKIEEPLDFLSFYIGPES